MSSLRDSITNILKPFPSIPELDENGNILASVSLRRDILANLLTIADAAEGEVAIATDCNAYVVYQGDPSVGKVYYRGGVVAFMNPLVFDSAVAGGDTDHIVSIIGGQSFPSGLIDHLNNEILAVSEYQSLTESLLLEVTFSITASGLDAGATLTVILQRFNGSTWGSFHNSEDLVADGTGNITEIVTALDIISILNTFEKYRVVINQSSVGTCSVSLNLQFVIKQV